MRYFALILSILLSANFAYAEEDEDKKADSAVEYVEIKPKFIVNLDGKRRSYMRANVQLLVAGKDHAEKILKHTPAIRHSMLMLFSGYSAKELATAAQREALRKTALDEVRETLNKYADSDGLRDLFFTELLVQ